MEKSGEENSNMLLLKIDKLWQQMRPQTRGRKLFARWGIEKAYNYVNQGFLMATMEILGLKAKPVSQMRQWVRFMKRRKIDFDREHSQSTLWPCLT